MRFTRRIVIAVALVSALVGSAPDAHATTMLPQNLADLVSLSQDILVGEVIALGDGFDDRGVPYTEVTLRVDESLQGTTASTYTFRQFGLMEPRQMPDGSTYLGVSPEGWPRFRQDERVMLFLHEGSRQTGLRTTVGLLQGKFTIVDDTIRNGAGNANVFHELHIDTSTLSVEQFEAVQDPQRMSARAFIDLVREAVDGRWVEQGRLQHEQH